MPGKIKIHPKGRVQVHEKGLRPPREKGLVKPKEKGLMPNTTPAINKRQMGQPTDQQQKQGGMGKR